MKITSKHLIAIAGGLVTLVNLLLLHNSWKNSELSKEDKITKNLRKHRI